MAKTRIVSTKTLFYIFRTVHKSTFLNREPAHSQELVIIFYKFINIFIGIHRWISLRTPQSFKSSRRFTLKITELFLKWCTLHLTIWEKNNSLEFTEVSGSIHFREQKQWQITGFPYNYEETSQDRCYRWKKYTTKLHTYICFLASCFYFLALDVRLSGWVFFRAWGESI